jgi:hypothetical protein
VAHVQTFKCNAFALELRCRECRKKSRGACQFLHFRALFHDTPSTQPTSTTVTLKSTSTLFLDWSLLHPDDEDDEDKAASADIVSTDASGASGEHSATTSTINGDAGYVNPLDNNLTTTTTSPRPVLSVVPGHGKYIRQMIAPTLKAILDLEVALLRSSSAATTASSSVAGLSGCALIDAGSIKWDHLTRLLITPPLPTATTALIVYPPIYRRPNINRLRTLCDICETSIFNSCWMCGVCGIELCTLCFDEWNRPPNSEPTVIDAALQKKVSSTSSDSIPRIQAQAFKLNQKRMAMCSGKRFHVKAEFVRTYRLPVPELAAVTSNVGDYLLGSAGSALGSAYPQKQQQQQQQQQQRLPPPPPTTSTSSSLSSPKSVMNNSTSLSSPPLPRPVVDLEAESDHLPSFQADEINLDNFRRHWKRGEPVAVRDIKMSRDWSSRFFEENFGGEATDLVNCMTGETVGDWTVGQFFKEFRSRPVAGTVKRKRSRVGSDGDGDGVDTYDALKFKVKIIIIEP